MRALAKLTYVETKLLLREPVPLFLTAVLPIMLLVVTVDGNSPDPAVGGVGGADGRVPGYLALNLATLGLATLPGALAVYREQGVLRRLGASPLPALNVLAAQALVQMIVGTLSAALLIGVAVLGFDLRLPRSPLALALWFVVGGVALAAVGMLLAAVLPTSRAAGAAGLASYLPMIFICGAAVPRASLPDDVREVGEWLPLGFVVDALQAAWQGEEPGIGAVAATVVMIVVGGLLSVRLFKWE